MLTQSRLIELQIAANSFVEQYPVSGLLLPATEVKALIDELTEKRDHPRYREIAELRADRVRLQGAIERLTHENDGLREHLNHAGETLLDAADRAVTFSAPGEIEALAQRLAEAEALIVVHKEILARRRSEIEGLGERIDQVCEIIGTRIGGLEERLARLEQAPEQFVLHENVKVTSGALSFGVQPNPPGFPTGAGTTVEDVFAGAVYAEEAALAIDPSEPLKPQRGDRVRLEGARSPSGRPISDGWYDVIGGDATEFQVHDKTSGDLSHFSPWLSNSSPSLKEVRRGAAKLPE